MDNIPEGYCQCGCGKYLGFWTHNDRTHGRVKGEPKRYARGHSRSAMYRMSPPNPSGLCMCGCGTTTPLAGQTRTEQGTIRGQHIRYCPGHHLRTSVVDYTVEDRGYKTPCWVWQRRKHNQGYGTLGANGPLAHRAYYEAEYGPLSGDCDLHHRCEVRLCVNPSHLTPVTRGEHKRLHEWHGERVNWAKLCAEDVRQMRRLRDEGWTYRAIGKKFWVSRQGASDAIRGKTWRHI